MHIFERFLPFLSFVCVRCVYSQHTAEERTMRNARWGFIKGKISIYIYVVENRLFIAVELDMNRNHFEWKSKLNWDFDTCHPFRRIHRICIYLFLFTFQLFFGTMIRFLFDCSYNMYNGHIDGHCTCVWCMYQCSYVHIHTFAFICIHDVKQYIYLFFLAYLAFSVETAHEYPERHIREWLPPTRQSQCEDISKHFFSNTRNWAYHTCWWVTIHSLIHLLQTLCTNHAQFFKTLFAIFSWRSFTSKFFFNPLCAPKLCYFFHETIYTAQRFCCAICAYSQYLSVAQHENNAEVNFLWTKFLLHQQRDSIYFIFTVAAYRTLY